MSTTNPIRKREIVSEMPDDIQIKQFELSEQDALLSFLRVAYPGEPRKSEPDFWKWHFVENPYASPDNIPLWIVRTEKEIVGQMASIPVEVKVNGEVKRALWIIDFILDPAYRGRKLGKQLMQAALETYGTPMLSLGYNDNSWAVLRSHKWKPLGNITRYHILLFPGDAAREISRFTLTRKAANLFYAPFRPSSNKLRPHGGGEVREVTSFDASFDDLWQRASAQWPCSVVRSARYLEWQYIQQPGKKFDVLGYYNQDRLLGYLVLYFRKADGGGFSPKVAITDLCYDSEDAQQIIDELLKAALRLALDRHAGAVVTDVRDQRVEQRLRQIGFRRMPTAPPFAALTTERQDLIYEASNWFLTRGDCDVSIFEDPNL